MSQFFIEQTGSSPAVPISFTTDDGVATTDNDNLNIIARDTEEDNPNGIQTEGSGSTVAIELTNRKHAVSIVCPPSVNTQILSFDLGAIPSSYRIFCWVVGRQDTIFGATIGYTLTGTFLTNGALAVQVGSTWKHSDEDIPKTETYITLGVDGGNSVELVLHNDGVLTDDMIVSALLEYIVV